MVNILKININLLAFIIYNNDPSIINTYLLIPRLHLFFIFVKSFIKIMFIVL